MTNIKSFVARVIIAFMLLIAQSSKAICQNYLALSLNDIILIKGEDYELKKSDGLYKTMLIYEKPIEVVVGGRIRVGKKIESFGFDANSKAIRYFRFDTVDPNEVTKIVKANNQEFQRVKAELKYFQWIDTKNNYSITLNIVPIDDHMVISYEMTKE